MLRLVTVQNWFWPRNKAINLIISLWRRLDVEQWRHSALNFVYVCVRSRDCSAGEKRCHVRQTSCGHWGVNVVMLFVSIPRPVALQLILKCIPGRSNTSSPFDTDIKLRAQYSRKFSHWSCVLWAKTLFFPSAALARFWGSSKSLKLQSCSNLSHEADEDN